jgi:hypothetical protein
MGNNDVVCIRVEALGVSITIADGNIAIEQTKAEKPAVTAASKGRNQKMPKWAIPAITNGAVAANGSQPLPDLPEIPALGKSPSEVTSHRPSPENGSAGLSEDDRQVESPSEDAVPAGSPEDSGTDFAHSGTTVPASGKSGQTRPLWSNEEVEKLKALWPAHSASAIAKELGRSFNAVRGKAEHLGLRKDGPPTVTSKPAKAAPKPRSLSAAVTADPVLTGLARSSRRRCDPYTSSRRYGICPSRYDQRSDAYRFQCRIPIRSSSRSMSLDSL